MATPITTSIPVIKTQDLVNSDAALVSSITQENFFNPDTDFIDAFVYDINNVLIRGINTNYTVLNTKIENNTIKEIQIDPSQDLQSNLYNTGIYNIQYNFLRNATGVTSDFYLKEISSDRTEIRIDNNNLNASQMQEVFNKLSSLLNGSESFKGIYLSPNDDNFLLIVNVGFDSNTILLKLYQPLPTVYDLKTNVTIDEKVSEPQAYQVEWLQEEVPFDDRIFLKGPNFNLNIKNQVNNSTEYKNNNNIYTSSLSILTSQLGSILAERRAELNTDYTDYNNFVFFSSAEQRLSNFYYKAKLIENYNNEINILNSLTPTSQVSSSTALIQSKINDIVTNFDGYDYFLYFDSGSKSWPKSTSTPPYTLYSTGSSQVLTWFAEQSESASLFDGENSNYIYNIFPTYLTEDPDNSQFQLFTEMAAQMFDEIWLYTQAIKNRQDGDNSLEGGISKDLVADALRSYGLTLYQSSFTDINLFTSLLGIDQDGSTLPPTGSELITNYITSSAETTPFDDAQKLIYKRLYHNLPVLLKKKGTVAGLRILLSCFGIPDTLIRISEFGGKDKNPNTWDLWENRFNYNYYTTGSGQINIPFKVSSAGFGSTFPKAIAFRFKTNGLPTGSINYSQSLAVTQNNRFFITLEYTGSGYISGSYNSSIIDPNYQYATLKFISGSQSSSVYLPFFNGDWWSVLVNADSGSTTTYSLYAKNKIYNGDDGNIIGFQASSSFVGNMFWSNAGTTQLILPTSSVSNGKTYLPFSGSYQEFRYYTTPLNENSFDDYVMNPSSIEGNSISNSQSSKNIIMFRLPLGGELYINSSSVHPAITGSYPVTQSFNANPQTASFVGNYSFVPNIETIYFDQPSVGLKNRVSNKIKQSNLILPTEGTGLPQNDILSSLIRVQQNFPISQSYTSDLNLAEIAYSPQNEINDDINNSLGYFNIGDYLDIRTTGSSYSALSRLRDEYFQKYQSSYNYKDYIRLIKYFDNALFKMIKDYVPARTSISTGIVIKQHILERNKYSEPTVTFIQPEYTSSINMYTITGSDGGVFELQNVTQSWSGSYITPSGSVPYIHSTEDEFFNGEFSGSEMIATDGDLGTTLNPLINNTSTYPLSQYYMKVDYNSGQLIPTNFNSLINGTGTKAPIKDYYYTLRRQILPRYEGSRLQAYQINAYTSSTDNSYGKSPVIERYSDYFIYFDWIGGANPQYPGGGNVHGVYLIGIDGIATPLTTDNLNLGRIENLFKQGTTANILPAVYSAGNTPSKVEIVDGGALYNTIVINSGSNLEPSFAVYYSSSYSFVSNVAAFTTQSNIILTDTGSIYRPWLYPFLTTSSSISGSVRAYGPGLSFQIYNKTINQYAYDGLISQSDTYFPLQVGDIIRFGDTGSSASSSVDSSFTALGVYQIANISIGNDLLNSSSITLTSLNTTNQLDPNLFTWDGSSSNRKQKYRIMRRIPNESFVLIKNIPSYTDPGFLIPGDFNPNYDPYELAKKAGIIT